MFCSINLRALSQEMPMNCNMHWEITISKLMPLFPGSCVLNFCCPSAGLLWDTLIRLPYISAMCWDLDISSYQYEVWVCQGYHYLTNWPCWENTKLVRMLIMPRNVSRPNYDNHPHGAVTTSNTGLFYVMVLVFLAVYHFTIWMSYTHFDNEIHFYLICFV